MQFESEVPECVGINVRRGVEGNTAENPPLLCAALGMPRGSAEGDVGFKGKRVHVGGGDFEEVLQEEHPLEEKNEPLSNAVREPAAAAEARRLFTAEAFYCGGLSAAEAVMRVS